MSPRPDAVLCALALLASPAVAQESAPPPVSTAVPASLPHDSDFWTRDVLTGDWGGARSALEDAGFLFGADTIDEVLGNPVGGTRQGTIYEGRLELIGTVDLDRALGWTGATLHANAYQIHGRGLSANNLGSNLTIASDIEATRSLRLFDLWLEQVFLNTTLSIRAGQIAADDEFFISQTAATFVNATFGWPGILSADLPSGGPAYPLATPGIRLKYAATSTVSGLLGVFNGDPAGPGPGNPQERDASGAAFRLGGSAFALFEIDYAKSPDPGSAALASSYKLGAWVHSGDFADQGVDASGMSLASPTSSGIPALHRDNGGAYLVLDQEVMKEPGPPQRSVSIFFRASGAPSDRNEVSLYADAGIDLTGFVAGRENDVLGLAAAVARISSRARALDEDTRQLTGLGLPVRDAEAVVELTYRSQITPWWTLQPDIQFIHHPNGGVAAPGSPPGTRPIADALMLGLRSAILF